MKSTIIWCLMIMALLMRCSSPKSPQDSNYLRYEILKGSAKGSLEVFVTDSSNYVLYELGSYKEWRKVMDDSLVVVRGDESFTECAYLDAAFSFVYLLGYNRRWQKDTTLTVIDGESIKQLFLNADRSGDTLIIESHPDALNSTSYFEAETKFLPLAVLINGANGAELSWQLMESKTAESSRVYSEFEEVIASCEPGFPEPFIVDPRVGTPFGDDQELKFIVANESDENLMSNAEISVELNQEPYFTFELSEESNRIYLPVKGEFRVSVRVDGYFPKVLNLNYQNVPKSAYEGGLSTELSYTMIEIDDRLDSSLFTKPIGILRYVDSLDAMTWDFDYTREQQSMIEKARLKLRDSSTP